MRRPESTTPYIRPNHFRESLEAQKLRHQKEMDEASLNHSLKMGKKALRDLETSLMQGNIFDEVTASIMMRGQLRMDQVKPEHIDAVIATFLPQYLNKVGGD